MDYFDFESEIENIDKVLSTLDVNDIKSTNNIEKLNTEKKYFYLKNLFKFKSLAESSNIKT